MEPTIKASTASIAAAAAALTLAFALPADPASGSLKGTVVLDPLPEGEAGKVVLEGEKPEVKPLEIDAEKSKGCGTVATTNETLIVNDKGGIANVVVIVEVEGQTVKPLEKPFELDQKSCRFEPHVTVVPVGSTVEFRNSDETGHNVHIYPGKNEIFNQTIPPKSAEQRKFDKEDRIEVKCDIHPWMNSYLIVANSNFYAVTGADGSFKIEGLPAGEHKVSYWHEKLGKQSGTIKVAEGGKVEPVEVKMSAEKKAGGGRRK
jgi:plastocyanin